jgi:hypothetical protein
MDKRFFLQDYKIIILILIIGIYFGCSSKNEDGLTFNRKNLSPTMYKMLGMLSEYISRFNMNTGKPGKDLVETFYPKEKKMAQIFEGLIEQYRKETKKDFKYYKKIGKQGHISFYSEELSKIINSFYVMMDRVATLDKMIFFDADTNSKLAFIEGVYLRYGHENTNLIRMVNALNKMDTIGFVLKTLDCKHVYIYHTMGLIPKTVEIIFEPGDSLKRYLKIEAIISKERYTGKEYFHFCKEIEE